MSRTSRLSKFPFSTRGSEIRLPDGSLQFAVRPLADDIVEAHEVFRVACWYPEGAEETPPEGAFQFYGGLVTIHDNDEAEVSVAPVTPGVVKENAGPGNTGAGDNGMAQFTVTLTA